MDNDKYKKALLKKLRQIDAIKERVQKGEVIRCAPCRC